LKIFSNENIEAEAEGILVKYVDQEFSYVDAVSFVIMKRQKIRRAFCFDKHFVTAGFMNIP
jgi:predicted nucleic acid-binding protein